MLLRCDSMTRRYPHHAPHIATRLVPVDDGLLAAACRTLDENAHLADGDDCTLIHLKRAVEKVIGHDAFAEKSGKAP